MMKLDLLNSAKLDLLNSCLSVQPRNASRFRGGFGGGLEVAKMSAMTNTERSSAMTIDAKFRELDSDNVGVLTGVQLTELAYWVCCSLL